MEAAQQSTIRVSFYFQYKKADYADYLPGYYYIAPKDLVFEGELYVEKSDKPLD